MAGRKKAYADIKIPVSFGIKRCVINKFKQKVEEMGFNRSEVVEELINQFLKQ